MKRTLIILIIGIIFTSVSAQADNTLKKGMLNTLTLSNGEVIYDLNGEWDALFDNAQFGTSTDIIKITQEGNKFIGIKLIGNQFSPKGTEIIRGELEKDGFKSIETKTIQGWRPAIVKISENCNKIITETLLKMGGETSLKLMLTLTRK